MIFAYGYYAVGVFVPAYYALAVYIMVRNRLLEKQDETQNRDTDQPESELKVFNLDQQ